VFACIHCMTFFFFFFGFREGRENLAVCCHTKGYMEWSKASVCVFFSPSPSSSSSSSSSPFGSHVNNALMDEWIDGRKLSSKVSVCSCGEEVLARSRFGAIIQDDGLLLLFLFIIIIVVVVIVFKGYLVLTCYVCISVFIFWS